MWVRSSLEETKYLFKFIFPFLRSGVEAKRGVEFCHSTRNPYRIRRKVGIGVSSPAYPAVCGIQRVADLFFKYPQVTINDVTRRLLSEKDRQLELLREREQALSRECTKYRDTIQQLTDPETNDYDSLLKTQVF